MLYGALCTAAEYGDSDFDAAKWRSRDNHCQKKEAQCGAEYAIFQTYLRKISRWLRLMAGPDGAAFAQQAEQEGLSYCAASCDLR